jgi:DNA-binding Lrp family transcriptional regulator
LLLAFFAHPNPAAIGFPVVAIIGLDVEPKKMRIVIDELRKREEIRWIHPTSGRYDIILMGWFASNETIYFFLKRLLGQLKE